MFETFNVLDNPFEYIILFLIYCILSAIILPLPVEIGLAGFFTYASHGHTIFGLDLFSAFFLLCIVMGLGKAIGSAVVFYVGVSYEKSIRKWLKWKIVQRGFDRLSNLCANFGYLAMYILLCIPIFPDTVPLYIFSLLNKNGKVFENKWFILTNFFAGMARGICVGLLIFGEVN